MVPGGAVILTDASWSDTGRRAAEPVASWHMVRVQMNPLVMRRRVADARIARLGTVDPRNRPHLVPCCFVVDGETLFSPIDDVKPKSNRTLRRVRNIRRHPAVTVLVDHYDEDWRQLWWIRLDGTAHVAEASPTRENAIGLLIDKYPQYDSTSFRSELIVVDISTWTGWP